MTTTPSILAFNDITRSFTRGKRVLDGVTFSVEGEGVVALLGRNGAGKSTLLQIAMGMLFPDSGSVRVFGMSPVDKPVEVKRRVGFMAEGQVLPPTSTIGELISFHRYLFPTWDRAFEKELLDRFGLAGNGQRIAALSNGQQRQVALLCAICHRPELLILDEPAGGLDPAARREFLETSVQLLNREGTAIIFSSHQMGDVERLGGRVVLLHEGKVRLDRPLDALREEFSVAVVSKSVVADSARILAVPGCVRVRAALNEWHAVFERRPAEARAALVAALGTDDVVCTTVPLEELFVDLVGGEHTAAAA
ncbi:MAG: ABC transporter ATP-binding protein [Gemmatimonadota bacterium]